MNKEQLIEKLGNGFDFDIHFYSNAGRDELADFILDHAKQQAIAFAEFLHPDEDGNHWQMYDGYDRWINLKTNEVLSTSQLYNLFINQTENK